MGSRPDDRRPTQARKARTKSGTSGGRFTSASVPASRRWRTLRTAITGASMTTRASLTTTATASAPPPIAPPAATTCATSWIEPPAHRPHPPRRGRSRSTATEFGNHARPEDDDQRDSGEHLFLVGVDDSVGRGHRSGSADREATGDQESLRPVEPEQRPANIVPKIPSTTIAITTAIMPSPVRGCRRRLAAGPARPRRSAAASWPRTQARPDPGGHGRDVGQDGAEHDRDEQRTDGRHEVADARRPASSRRR